MAACLILTAATAAVAAPAAPEDPVETEPLWEAGVGGFVALTPNYPASGEYAVNGLPLPYLIYRGELVRIGGDSAASLVPLDTDRFEFGVSADAAFGADSDDNELREGLPDLDPLIEVGPEFVVKAAGFGLFTEIAEVELALQGRSVFSIDFEDAPEFQGLVFEPQLRASRRGIIGPRSFGFAAVGSIFATEGLHDYFYEVPAAFARPGRPAFDAGAGYLGAETTFGVGYEVTERFSVFAGGEVGLYAGSANADSPLFEDEVTGSVLFGASYSFFQSEARAPRR